MSEKIKILVGTMTGTAELVASEIAEVLENRGADAEIVLMDDLTADVFEPASAYIVCTSTYGQGDVPDNARTLFESLKADRPDLSAIRYGLFALGDMTYAQTFCFGGRRFDDILQELGARRIGEREEHDASSGSLPEDEAATWAEGWYELFAASAEGVE
jgi:MioC protein